MASCRHWTLAEPFTLEVEVKKSQFIATAWPVTSTAQVTLLDLVPSNPMLRWQYAAWYDSQQAPGAQTAL